MRSYFEKRQQCPMCGHKNFRSLYQAEFLKEPIRSYLKRFYHFTDEKELSYLVGGSYHLAECENCDGVFQVEIPNRFLMGRLYEKWTTLKDLKENKGSQDRLLLASKNIQEALSLLALCEAKSETLCVLDFGMGYGDWIRGVAGFGIEAYGIEIASWKKKRGRELKVPMLSEKGLKKNQFDFINTEQVSEHLTHPLETLKRLASSLKQKGKIKISVPAASGLKRRLKTMDFEAPKGTVLGGGGCRSRRSLNLVAPLEHINCYRRLSLLKMAQAAHLKEIRLPLNIQYRHSNEGLR